MIPHKVGGHGIPQFPVIDLKNHPEWYVEFVSVYFYFPFNYWKKQQKPEDSWSTELMCVLQKLYPVFFAIKSNIQRQMIYDTLMINIDNPPVSVIH